MPEITSMVVRIGAEITDFQRKMDRVQSRLRGIESVARTAFGAVIGGGLLAAGKAAVSMASDVETLNTQIQRVTKSAAETAAVMGEIRALAKAGPLEFATLSGLSRQLMAVGVLPRQIISDIRLIGAAVQSVGGGALEIERAAEAMAKLRSRGKVTADQLQEINQFFPALKLITKELGGQEQLAARIKAGLSGRNAYTALLRAIRGEGLQFQQGFESPFLALKAQIQDIVAANGPMILNLFRTLSDAVGLLSDNIQALGVVALVGELAAVGTAWAATMAGFAELGHGAVMATILSIATAMSAWLPIIITIVGLSAGIYLLGRALGWWGGQAQKAANAGERYANSIARIKREVDAANLRKMLAPIERARKQQELEFARSSYTLADQYLRAGNLDPVSRIHWLTVRADASRTIRQIKDELGIIDRSVTIIDGEAEKRRIERLAELIKTKLKGALEDLRKLNPNDKSKILDDTLIDPSPSVKLSVLRTRGKTADWLRDGPGVSWSKKPGDVIDENRKILMMRRPVVVAEDVWQMTSGLQRAVDLANEFGEAFSQASVNIISQASSIGEAFKQMGQAILNQITMMIAKIVALTIAMAVFRAIGLGGPAKLVADAIGMNSGGGLKVPKLAEGGILTRPQLVLAGERGPEAIVPLPKLANMGGDTYVYIDGKEVTGAVIRHVPAHLKRKGLAA